VSRASGLPGIIYPNGFPNSYIVPPIPISGVALKGLFDVPLAGALRVTKSDIRQIPFKVGLRETSGSGNLGRGRTRGTVEDVTVIAGTMGTVEDVTTVAGQRRSGQEWGFVLARLVVGRVDDNLSNV
jgi:hypothetical protein